MASAVPALTFSIADYRKPESRRGHSSNEIIIPRTKANEQVIGSFDPLTTEDFDDKAKNNYHVLDHSGVTVSEGVIDVFSKSETEYKARLYANNSEWQLKGSIRSLDLGNWFFGRQEVEDSWDAVGDLVRFPLVDFGEFVDYNASSNIKAKWIRPAVNALRILEKAFLDEGYYVQAKGTAKKILERLEIYYTGDLPEAPQKTKDEATVLAGNNRVLYRNRTKNTGDLIRLNPYIDPLGLWNNQTIVSWPSITVKSEYVCRFDGVYDFEITGELVTSNVVNHQNGSTAPNPALLLDIDVDQTFYILTNIQNNALGQETLPTISIAPAGLNTRNVSITITGISGRQWQTFSLGFAQNGKTIYAQNPMTYGPVVSMNNIEFKVTPRSIPAQLGTDIEVSKVLPDMGKRELLAACVNAFDLRINTSHKRKTVDLITRDEFYKKTVVSDDWENKIDFTEEPKIEKLTEVSKRAVFRYAKENSDSNLSDSEAVQYADEEREMDDHYLKGERVFADLPFAATYMGRTLGSSIYAPLMYKRGETPQTPDEDSTVTMERTARWLMNGGSKPGNWTFEGRKQTRYGLSYFIPQGDGYSLSFNNSSGNIGLVDRLYKGTLSTLNNSKMLVAYLQLDGTDIQNLDFTKPKKVRIPGGHLEYFLLNKIESYKPEEEDSTYTELIQVPNG